MFNCSYVRERYKTLTYEDLPIIKVLTPLQRLSLKSDYFASIDEVALDLCWGPLYSIYTGILKLIKLILVK